jgi:hypothetical protein
VGIGGSAVGASADGDAVGAAVTAGGSDAIDGVVVAGEFDAGPPVLQLVSTKVTARTDATVRVDR